MNHRLRNTFSPLALACCLGAMGCATMSDVLTEKREGGGLSRDYAVDPTTALTIAREVFREEGAEAIEDHPEDWSLRATMGADAFTYGTIMGAWIETSAPGHVRVTVVTKRKLATTLATGLTEETFQESFRTHLANRVRGVAAPPAPVTE